MPANTTELEKRLWSAADELRANSKLKASEYSVPVLGLIFLRYADYKFSAAAHEMERKTREGGTEYKTRRRLVTAIEYQAQGVLFLPEDARFETLVNLPEASDIGKAINAAMKAIEDANPDLKDVLPKTYARLDKSILVELLRDFNGIPMDIEGDAFGKIYEYFLGKFAMSEGQKGGEFFTPLSLVQLIVEVIEPFHGLIWDPACGSGGMFVQSARFVQNHKGKPNDEIAIYGQERVAETIRLSKMNLAVHGLTGDIRQANSYYEDPFKSTGKFDFVMANPPFNVDRVNKDEIKDDKARFPFGMPANDNGNYLWIQLFYSGLNERGRAGFVMANSASDARGSELTIRQKLIEAGAVDVMIAVGPNFFYTVTLPCTLWFLDKGKRRRDGAGGRDAAVAETLRRGDDGGDGNDVVETLRRNVSTGDARRRDDTVLFIDARHIFRQVDRAHREFTPAQIEFVANIVRLYRGEPVETDKGSADLMAQHFPNGRYADVAGLCKAATRKEIEAQGWSMNPGRYVGVAEKAADDFDFKERLEELNEELETLNAEARELEARIGENVESLLGLEI